jgi:23S rRNA (uracil1939-C5)-methyltransferase
MFPWTGSVETVVLLSKLSSAPKLEVKIKMSDLDLTEAEAKATYDEIQEYVKEQTGLHVTHLNIAQIKRKHGIIERANYNLPKSENSRQPNCPPEKEKAIVAALKHFKMID